MLHPPATFIQKMMAALHAEIMECLKHVTWLNPENQNCILDTVWKFNCVDELCQKSECLQKGFGLRDRSDWGLEDIHVTVWCV
jgi:hypothetical protein